MIQVTTSSGQLKTVSTYAAGPLTSSYIFVGNASNVATAVPMSGNATISNTGVVTIGSGLTVTTNAGTIAFSSAALTLTVTATGTVAVGTGSVNRVTYWSGTNALTSSANFMFDGTTVFIGGTSTSIGTESMLLRIDQNAATRAILCNATSNTAARSLLSITTSATVATSLSIQTLSAGFTSSGINTADAAVIASNLTAGLNVGTSGGQPYRVYTNNTERCRITATGELLGGYSAVQGSEFFGFVKNQNAASFGVISNSTSNTAARSFLQVTNSATNVGGLFAISHSAGFTTSGMNVASTCVVDGVSSGGLNVGTSSNSQVSIWANNTQFISMTATGRTFFGGSTTATALVHLAAGTATASTGPLKFTSGTNLTTAEAGSMEYNGTNLFFTRTGTVRENVLVAIDNVAAPSTAAGAVVVNYYGSAATNFLGDPNRWLSVNILGSTYKIPLYT